MRTVHMALLLAGVLAVQATSASAQGSREPRYRDVTKLGGDTSFYTKRPLTDAASLKAMADTRNMDRDIREVLVQGGVVPAAAASAVTADILAVMRGQLTPRRGGSCLTENPAEIGRAHV